MSCIVALLNTAKLNFDGRLDLAPIREVADELREHDVETEDEVIEAAQGCDILVSKEQPLKISTLRRLPPSVRLICEAGTGIDNIEVDPSTLCHEADGRRIDVRNVSLYSTEHVAQITIEFLLMLSSGVHRLLRRVERGERSDFDRMTFTCTELREKTLGIVGAGNIGLRVRELALAFGMEVIVHRRSGAPLPDGSPCVGLDHLLERSDYVSLHCPKTAETVNLIDAAAIAKMKPGACVVNASRGGLVNEKDLVQAIRAGRLKGAALDTQEHEPPDAWSPLWREENVIMTPHHGWKNIESRNKLVIEVSRIIASFNATVGRDDP